MAELENPAGRLHALLTEFGSKTNISIANAWAQVLGVSPDEVHLHLGGVGRLLADTRRAAQKTGSSHWEPMDQHLAALSECIFPQRVPFSNRVNDLRPNNAAMQMLGTLSYALQLSSREGQIPEDDEIEALRSSLHTLLTETAEAEIPAEIRRALLDRLNQMLEALDHLNVGGPDAVRRAAEALAISAILCEGDSEDAHPIFQRVKQAARATWIVFTVATQFAAAGLTWDRIVNIPAIGPAVERPQLPAGPGPANDADESANDKDGRSATR